MESSAKLMRKIPENYTRLCREDALTMNDSELQQAIIDEANLVLYPVNYCQQTIELSKVRIQVYKTTLLERQQFLLRTDAQGLSVWA